MTNYQRAVELQPELEKHRRFLHQHGERGLDLPMTSNYVMEQLTAMGYQPKRLIDHGIVAAVGNPNGKTVLLRADMDALPIAEESGLEFSSTTSYAHCCGHDLHTASLLGAAQLLKEQEEELDGMVKLMFQPAEETAQGAQAMMEAGVLTDAPAPDVAVMTHVTSQAPVGMIFTGKGTMMSSCDGFSIYITGMGGHGSQPEQVVDVVSIGTHIHLGFQHLMAREVPMMNHAILTIPTFQAGDAWNVFPSTAVLKGTLRCQDEPLRHYLLGRMKEIVESVAKTYKGEARLEMDYGMPSFTGDPEFYQQVVPVLQELDPSIRVMDVPPASGSEDFSFISQEIPTLVFMIGAQDPTVKQPYPLHHPQVTFDEKALAVGAAVYTEIAEKWLAQNK